MNTLQVYNYEERNAKIWVDVGIDDYRPFVFCNTVQNEYAPKRVYYMFVNEVRMLNLIEASIIACLVDAVAPLAWCA